MVWPKASSKTFIWVSQVYVTESWEKKTSGPTKRMKNWREWMDLPPAAYVLWRGLWEAPNHDESTAVVRCWVMCETCTWLLSWDEVMDGGIMLHYGVFLVFLYRETFWSRDRVKRIRHTGYYGLDLKWSCRLTLWCDLVLAVQSPQPIGLLPCLIPLQLSMKQPDHLLRGLF